MLVAAGAGAAASCLSSLRRCSILLGKCSLSNQHDQGMLRDSMQAASPWLVLASQQRWPWQCFGADGAPGVVSAICSQQRQCCLLVDELYRVLLLVAGVVTFTVWFLLTSADLVYPAAMCTRVALAVSFNKSALPPDDRYSNNDRHNAYDCQS